LAQDRLSHDVPGSKGTNNQIDASNLGEDCRPTQMAYIEKDQPKQKREEEQRNVTKVQDIKTAVRDD